MMIYTHFANMFYSSTRKSYTVVSRAVLILFLLPVLSVSCFAQVEISYPVEVRGIDLALLKVKNALHKDGYTLKGESNGTKGGKYKINISIQPQHKLIQAEGYTIQANGSTINIIARDPSGARYGVLALTEQLTRVHDLTKITSITHNPPFAVRTIKFNLPWEPYRESRSMEYHLSTCRDLRFWESFLDMMFENRFNVLALYNMHPFPYLVKLDKYPEANSFTDAEMQEWKIFWKGMFRMAKDRGIDVFIVNWNIVIPETFAQKHHLKILNDTSSIVIDYTRESVTQMINEYEDLGGVGVTLADWMNQMTATQREDWIASTFVEGIKNAKRPTRFMHRSVLSGSPDEMRRIIDDAKLPDPVLVEVKFNWSHGHSTPHLALTHDNTSGSIDRGFWDPTPRNFKIEWMVRNEDFWILRWGDPDFIREHIRVNTHPYVDGYHIGSEGYIPAADYFTRPDIGKTWQYAFERQWLFYATWGRLLFNPGTEDKVFEEMFHQKYPFSNGRQMLQSYKLASRMPLQLASYFASTWDYTLYSEGFLMPNKPAGDYGYDDRKSIFITIDELIDHPVLDPKYISVKKYVELLIEKQKASVEKTSPLALATTLRQQADNCMMLLVDLRKKETKFNSAYHQELDDVQTWALLSRYFGLKLEAAVALESFRQGLGEPEKEKAVALLKEAYSVWTEISEITSANYVEVPYYKSNAKTDNPETDLFSWKKYLSMVERDITIAAGSFKK